MKKIFVNYFNFSAGEFISRIFNFFTVIYLARVLSVSNFGKINFAQSLGMYCLLFVSYGLDYIGLRELSKCKEKRCIDFYVSNIIAIRVVLFSIIYFCMFLGVLFMTKPFDIKLIIILYSLISLPYVFDLLWVFQALEKMHIITVLKATSGACLFLFIYTFVKTDSDIFRAAFCYPLSALLVAVIGIWIFRKTGKIKLSFEKRFWLLILKEATPVCLILLMNTFSFNIPLIMLGFMRSEKDMALFGAAYKIFLISVLPLGIWFQICAPRLARTSPLSWFFKKYIAASLIISFSIALVVFLMAPRIISILYGNEYNNSTMLLKIMSISIFISGLLVSFASPLVMWGYQKYHLFACTIGASCVVTSGFFLINKFGAFGASIASIISDLSVVCSVLIFLVFLFKKGSFRNIPLNLNNQYI